MSARAQAAGVLAIAALAWVPSASADTVIAILSDLYGTRHRAGVPAYKVVAKHQPAAIVALGDFDHRDPGRSGNPTQCRQAMREIYGETTRCTSASGCDFATHLASIPFYRSWDDHDYTVNNSDRTHPCRGIAIEEFKAANPATYPGDGIWRDVVIGPVHLFVLDLRSQRDPNPLPDNPGKTMLGAPQKAWLFERLQKSTAPWKVLASSVAFNPGTKPKDSWSGFLSARRELLAVVAGIRGVVVVSGDTHAGGALDDGTNSGLPELNVPHLNLPDRIANTFGKHPGVWSHGFLSGVGRPGYGLLTATPTRLTLEARGEDGTVRLTLTLTQ